MSETENAPVAVETDLKPEIHAYHVLSADRVTIAPNVLLAMIRIATLQVPGLIRMGNTPGGVNMWLRRTPAERGIQAIIEDQTVSVDIYIVVDAERNLRDVSQTVQKQVARTIEENVGMHVGTLNIHIEDVVFVPSAQE